VPRITATLPAFQVTSSPTRFRRDGRFEASADCTTPIAYWATPAINTAKAAAHDPFSRLSGPVTAAVNPPPMIQAVPSMRKGRDADAAVMAPTLAVNVVRVAAFCRAAGAE